MPLANTSYLTPTGESAVLWNSSAAAALFNALKTDQPVGPAARPARRRDQASRRLRPSQVAVDVYNGTLIGGLSAQHRRGRWPRSASGSIPASTGQP